MKSYGEWVLEIDAKIERLKESGKKYYYSIDAEMTWETADALWKKYRAQGYSIEVKKCKSCSNKYDVIIGWSQ